MFLYNFYTNQNLLFLFDVFEGYSVLYQLYSFGLITMMYSSFVVYMSYSNFICFLLRSSILLKNNLWNHKRIKCFLFSKSNSHREYINHRCRITLFSKCKTFHRFKNRLLQFQMRQGIFFFTLPLDLYSTTYLFFLYLILFFSIFYIYVIYVSQNDSLKVHDELPVSTEVYQKLNYFRYFKGKVIYKSTYSVQHVLPLSEVLQFKLSFIDIYHSNALSNEYLSLVLKNYITFNNLEQDVYIEMTLFSKSTLDEITIPSGIMFFSTINTFCFVRNTHDWWLISGLVTSFILLGLQKGWFPILEDVINCIADYFNVLPLDTSNEESSVTSSTSLPSNVSAHSSLKTNEADTGNNDSFNDTVGKNDI